MELAKCQSKDHFVNHKLMSRVYLQRRCNHCFWEWSEEHQGQNHMDKSTKC